MVIYTRLRCVGQQVLEDILYSSTHTKVWDEDRNKEVVLLFYHALEATVDELSSCYYKFIRFLNIAFWSASRRDALHAILEKIQPPYIHSL